MTVKPDVAGAEPHYFEHPGIDRALGLCLALGAEVWVLRDRVQRLETALSTAGILDVDAAPDPSEAERLASAAERKAFVGSLLAEIAGRQASRGPDAGGRDG